MKLIVISNPTNVNNEHSLLNAMFETGLEYFHLRKPNFTYNELAYYVEEIPQKYRNKVIIHSQHSLALEYGLRGVHYTKEYPFQELNDCYKSMHQSVSLHSLEDLKNIKKDFHYVFLSPVFDSISKTGYKSTFDLQEVELFLKKGKKHNSKDFFPFWGHEMTFNGASIALGGIDENTIPQAAELGFDGVAVLGALWQAKNSVDKFRKLADTCNSYNKIKDEFHI